MALYAFDGTSNSDDGPEEEDTNVVRFREVYAGANFEYLAGVGTRFGAVGHLLGGLFGSGGRRRIEEMYDTLCDNFANGDQDIDIVGYSRGAAFAVHFANKIAKQGIKGAPNPSNTPPIRFVGLFDLVASFGLSFNNVFEFQKMNLFWNVDSLPTNVTHCSHAMALNERREAFDITRPSHAPVSTKLTELWFRGVHGDIGGGNTNTSRSNIALQWMINQAQQAGVPINQTRAAEARYRFDPFTLAPISANKDLKVDKHRRVQAGDSMHESVDATLEINKVRHCRVLAAEQYNWSGVTIEAGASYQVAVAPDQTWDDGDMTCGPLGWKTEELPWYKESFVRFFENKRRANGENWFALMVALGDSDRHAQHVGQGTILAFNETFDLYLFANDLRTGYGNNRGYIDVEIRRLD